MPPINYIISLTTKTKKGMVKINENFLPTLDRHFPQKVKKGKKKRKRKNHDNAFAFVHFKRKPFFPKSFPPSHLSDNSTVHS